MTAGLFTVTEDNLNKGLRGIPVGYCYTSEVRPTEGLYYRGRAVKELAGHSPEEVIYLLYEGKMGSSQEVMAFSKDLQSRAVCKVEVRRAILSLPKAATPMDLFALAIQLAGVFEKSGNYRQDCLNLIAKIPEIAALVINYHAGWGETPSPKPELGYMENFTHMLNVPDKDVDSLNEVFRLFNVLHYDHGGGNLSTFVGKAVASGLEDLYGSITAAMNALAGPKHGMANQETLQFNREVMEEVRGELTKEAVEGALRARLAGGKLVFGFGHAVLRVEDTRASILYGVLEKKYKHDPFAKLALLLREAGPKVLQENPKISSPYPNVDAVSGTVLRAAGFPYEQYYTVLFGLARVVGIAIQIVDERDDKVPIYRPKYLYKERQE